MAKLSETKLCLNKETLRTLTAETANEVAGGRTVSCQTCYNNECYSANRRFCTSQVYQ